MSRSKTFTRLSHLGYEAITTITRARTTMAVMREQTIKRISWLGQLAFMATTTIVLLAFTFDQAGRGLEGLPTAVVYALTAGFGLEFIRSAWIAGAQRPPGQREARR